MKTTVTILLSSLFISAAAQNLVPNGSFEINNGCPSQIGQVDLADGWVNWGLTPDYFHSCANAITPAYGTPDNIRGFQTPRTGLAYMGLLTTSDLVTNQREFIGRELAQPLTIGTTYSISFWVSRVGQQVCNHASNNIGVRFTTVSNYSLVNPDTALNNAHVFATSIITDSIEWVHVTGMFTADSAYTHMGIGNYFDDANTLVTTGSPLSNYAYYLIDDVCVSPDPLFCNLPSGIEDVNQFTFSLFPNPASGTFTMYTKKSFHGEVRLVTLSGAQEFVKQLDLDPGASVDFEVSTLSPGIYLLILNGTDGPIVKKLVIY